MVNVNRVSSAVELTVSSPLCALAIWDAILRPSPRHCLLARAFPRKKGGGDRKWRQGGDVAMMGGSLATR